VVDQLVSKTKVFNIISQNQIESFSRSKLLKSKETVGVATKWKELWIYQVIRFIQSSAQGFMIENYRDSDKEAVRSASQN
jgi:acetylglutamate synthase